MKIKKITAVFTSAVFLCIFRNFPVSAIKEQINDTEYTIEDVRLLQDFLLAKPISTNLEGKHYELNNDGRLDVFDLCLMKQRILQDNQQNEIFVSTTDELKTALLNAKAGDTIILAPGEYESGDFGVKASLFHSDSDGTSSQPITIKSADPDNPAILKGTETQNGIVLYITGDYWKISNIICCNAQKGIILDNSNYSVISSVEVYNTGQEGIHLRDGSSCCQIVGAKVHDTGLAGSYGEAIYIGSAKSTSGYIHECDNNIVKGCVLGPNVSDESVDIKEYTTGNIIEECIMYGKGMTATDSFIDIKGNETIVRGNTCYSQDNTVITDAFQLHCQIEGWGINNIIYDNTVYFANETEYLVRTWNGTSCTVYQNTRNPVSSEYMYRAYNGSTITIK
ncbi:MAG: hypothetical protein K2K91_03925 [Ruminococcus sp.]|nr:hypothetical protein [Ruminococcus sp.]MDE7098897.1 hypothetical protein [Ruminococcus sp.]